MAKFNPKGYKSFDVDGMPCLAPERATLRDILPQDVSAVTVYEPNGSGQLIPRSEFNRPLPEGFTTHLTHVEKGAGEVERTKPIEISRNAENLLLRWSGLLAEIPNTSVFIAHLGCKQLGSVEVVPDEIGRAHV